MSNNCQVFTPKAYVEKMLDAVGYYGNLILDKYILENSCGEGNILVEVVKRYIEAAKGLNYDDEDIKKCLENYILGFEIDDKVLNICLENLDNEAGKYGIKDVKWNIKNKDYLKNIVEEKIDFIVGNPPYIMYQDLDVPQREYLRENFSSCFKGKFDYCYAFIEKSIGELSSTGRMAYIVPNSIFKNVFGKKIREIMIESILEIYDYTESSVFGNDILTSPAIICISHERKKYFFKYSDVDNNQTLIIDKRSLLDKWIFTKSKQNFKSEPQKNFGDYYKVSNSVATLLNSAFLINKAQIIQESNTFIEVKDYHLEKKIIRPAASLRNFSLNREEYIIFPYTYRGDTLSRFKEDEFEVQFPEINRYLRNFLKDLNNRKSDKIAKWFEYGRSQALSHLNQEKILLSSVITNEIRCYHLDRNTIPYSGFYVTAKGQKSLREAEEILKSVEFFDYIKVRGINANGKSLRISVKDIMNYPIN